VLGCASKTPDGPRQIVEKKPRRLAGQIDRTSPLVREHNGLILSSRDILMFMWTRRRCKNNLWNVSLVACVSRPPSYKNSSRFLILTCEKRRPFLSNFLRVSPKDNCFDTIMPPILSCILIMKDDKVLYVKRENTALFLRSKFKLFPIGFSFTIYFLCVQNIKPPVSKSVG